MKLVRSLQAFVIAGLCVSMAACSASSAESEPEPATSADELRLGFDLGTAELKVGLESKHMTMNMSGFELGVQVCAPGAEPAANGAKACELSVSLLGGRAWLESISFEEVKFAGVLPLRLDNLPLLFDGSSSRTDVGLGEGKCVFDATSSRPEVKTKAVPFEVIIDLRGQNAGGAPQENRTLADMVLDHLTVKLALTRDDFHACAQGCFDSTSNSPAAACAAQDDQMSGVLAGVLSGDLAELVRPMLHEALGRHTGRR